jgi:hypothetical protein
VVVLVGEVEPAEGRALDGADGGEVGVDDVVLDGEVGEAAEGFVAGVEDDDVDLLLR